MTEATPAIRRTNDGQTTRDLEVVRELYDDVSFVRGLGDSGKRAAIVGHDCPECGYDRMFRVVDISPVEAPESEYYCMRPACRYYLGDAYSYMFRHTPRPREPLVTDDKPLPEVGDLVTDGTRTGRVIDLDKAGFVVDWEDDDLPDDYRVTTVTADDVEVEA